MQAYITRTNDAIATIKATIEASPKFQGTTLEMPDYGGTIIVSGKFGVICWITCRDGLVEINSVLEDDAKEVVFKFNPKTIAAGIERYEWPEWYRALEARRPYARANNIDDEIVKLMRVNTMYAERFPHLAALHPIVSLGCYHICGRELQAEDIIGNTPNTAWLHDIDRALE